LPLRFLQPSGPDAFPGIAWYTILKPAVLSKRFDFSIHEGGAMNNNDVSRRSFMVRTIIAIFAFIGAGLGAALGGFGIIPALAKREAGWSDAGVVADLVVGRPEERRYSELVKSGWQTEKQDRTIWIVKKTDNSVVAYSSNCTHLGCGYRWVAAQQRFACPCHGSYFDINGAVLSGPAPRPLDTLPTRVENNRLLVQYEVFQVGSAEKVRV
jgi:menaquinol-cytochrome c reductase iron-sulfur subunit